MQAVGRTRQGCCMGARLVPLAGLFMERTAMPGLLLRLFLGLAFASSALAQVPDSLAVMPPLGTGPYPVACSNIAQDFTRVAPGETAQQYWEGVPNGGTSR